MRSSASDGWNLSGQRIDGCRLVSVQKHFLQLGIGDTTESSDGIPSFRGVETGLATSASLCTALVITCDDVVEGSTVVVQRGVDKSYW